MSNIRRGSAGISNLNGPDKTIDPTCNFYNLSANMYRGRELWSHIETVRQLSSTSSPPTRLRRL